jgi:UDP-3-O-[3-hydroxymyristoyl] glucosamine N-acyltransferase
MSSPVWRVVDGRIVVDDRDGDGHPHQTAAPLEASRAGIGGARLGRAYGSRGVCVGALAVLGADVRLGARVVVGAGTILEEGVEIGDDTVLGPRVVCGRGTRVGQRCRIKSGAVLGGIGFGYVSGRDGHRRVPHVGGCLIEDDVDIGANTCIDRGSIGDTVVGTGTRIDNWFSSDTTSAWDGAAW